MLTGKVEAAAIAAAIAGAAAAGWVVNGWRLGGELERLGGVVETQKQSIATLEGTNQRCLAGVADVKTAVQGFAEAATQRTAAAAAAMARAEQAAARHLQNAQDVLSRPMPAAGQECDQAAAEAAAYVRKRRGEP